MNPAPLRHVRWLDTVTRADLDAVGGKAACLGELAQAGLPVPIGFVIPAQALGGGSDLPGTGGLRTDVIEEVRSAYAALSAKTGRASVAVRSSGVLEDREAASFAGIYRTLLNVSGADEVVRAVAECVRSSAAEGVDQYRRARGLEASEATISVLVQDLVPADVAGVAFTVDPLMGDPNRIVIDATFGLGAAVVAGTVVPDHFVLSRKSGELLDVRLAFKDRQMRAVKEGQGTETIRIMHTKAQAPSLTKEELGELTRIALDAERRMGAPQDVEWARARGAFWVLQSRPVTTSAREAVSEEGELGAESGMTPALIEELVPSPLSPFAASYLEPAVVRALDDVGAWRKVPTLAARVVLGSGSPRWSSAPLESLARALPSPLDRGLDARIRVVDRRANAFQRWGFSALTRSKQRDVAELAIRVESFFWWQSMVDLEGISAASAIANLVEFRERLTRVIAHRIDSVFNLSAIAGLVEAHLDLVPTLTHGERADVWLGTRERPLERFLERLAEIARLAARTPKLGAILRGDAIEVMPKLEREWSADARRMRSAVKEVLRDYGHWSSVDIDLSTPSWREDPTALIGLLTSYLDLEPSSLPTARLARSLERGRAARQRALHALPPWRRIPLRRLMQRYVAAVHELFEIQDHLARVTDRARTYVAALGTRLTADSKLTSVSEIHWIGFDEVARLAGDTTATLPRRRNLAPPAPGAVTPDPRELPRRGRGCSPGTGRGPLRRVVTTSDLRRLSPGDVAWTPCPGRLWAPYLPLLAGLVVDSGAPLALGVLGAREVDVPTVVGAGAPPSSLSEGTWLEVDGTSGEITRAAVDPAASRAAS